MEPSLERKFTPVDTPVAGSRLARSGSLISLGKDGSSILMVVVLVGPELGFGAAVVSLSIFLGLKRWKYEVN